MSRRAMEDAKLEDYHDDHDRDALESGCQTLGVAWRRRDTQSLVFDSSRLDYLTPELLKDGCRYLQRCLCC